MPEQPSTTSFARQKADSRTGVRIGGVQRAGMLDWPGRVTATVFLAGCNLRCPFCHNPELVGIPRRLEEESDLLRLVADRRAWLDGIVITGGEPCMDEGLLPLMRTLKREGMPVKLDTNGSRPDVLERVLEERLVDYVAMDIKAAPDKYERAVGVREVWPLVERSVDLLRGANVDHEFRTTCYPLAVSPSDPQKIAARLVGGRRYVLQQFRPARTLDPAAVSVKPHSSETLCIAAERCSTYLPTTVRGGS